GWTGSSTTSGSPGERRGPRDPVVADLPGAGRALGLRPLHRSVRPGHGPPAPPTADLRGRRRPGGDLRPLGPLLGPRPGLRAPRPGAAGRPDRHPQRRPVVPHLAGPGLSAPRGGPAPRLGAAAAGAARAHRGRPAARGTGPGPAVAAGGPGPAAH